MERELSANRLAQLRELLAKEPDVEVAVLFGSAAAGRLTDESDVDIYLRLARGARWTPDRVRDLRWRLGDAVGRDVELVVEDRHATSVILRREVARRGVLIREARAGAWTGLRADAMIAYADLEPWMRRCGEGVRRAILAAEERSSSG
jgi:predicted nucleotidyltransferase